MRATAKSNGQLAGIWAPNKMPAAVLACHVVHRASPAPKKYQCLYAGASIFLVVRNRYRVGFVREKIGK